MRTWMTSGQILDVIIEQVAIKGGILLTERDVYEILGKSLVKEWASIFNAPRDTLQGVRPEFVQDCINIIRASIGNLPDATPGHIVAIKTLKETIGKGYDPGPIIDALSELVDGKTGINGKDISIQIAAKCKIPIEVVTSVLSAIGVWQDRALDFSATKINWDGVLPLSKLFNEETIPYDPSQYFDQRFLDFLAVNIKKKGKIHWRNFERLVAEFFKRLGYAVTLGPGHADGGIDIRVWSDSSKTNEPPLIIIQCKRYKDTVSVEYIKALYFDVVDAGAKWGLIVTTSKIGPTGKRICEAQQWRLLAAENKDVNKWIRSMWRYSWNGQSKTVGVGQYLLPPII